MSEEELKKEKEKKEFKERQLVIFRLGSEEFGVDINEVREIIKLETFTKIPNAEDYIDGVINLRGKIIVIIDLEKKFGLPLTERNKDSRIIVIEVGDSTIGMIVDGCNEVLRLTENQIEPAPKIITNKIQVDYLDGVGILKDRLVILLDLGKVIGEIELVK
jgi:purine-binding chemotaxis protein CheW